MFAKYARVVVYTLGILIRITAVAVERSRGAEDTKRQKLMCERAGCARALGHCSAPLLALSL